MTLFLLLKNTSEDRKLYDHKYTRLRYTSHCCSEGSFESTLVANLEDKFSSDEAQVRTLLFSHHGYSALVR